MYSPKLDQELVQRLYAVCQELGVPMTVFVNGALERAMLRAEEYLVMEGKERVLDMIGVERPQRQEEGEQQRPAVAAG
jgi:predicted DNA-binding protein